MFTVHTYNLQIISDHHVLAQMAGPTVYFRPTRVGPSVNMYKKHAEIDLWVDQLVPVDSLISQANSENKTVIYFSG